MARTELMIRRFGPALASLGLIFALSGCPKDPYEADTWIEKLDEPREAEHAVTQLEGLKDPKAIKPLGEIWRKRSHWSRAFRAIISLADQPTAKDGPFWRDAIPYLEEAVKDYDPGDQKSVGDAVMACDALGKAKNADSVRVLVDAANDSKAQNLPKLSPGQNVRIAAIRALGNYGTSDEAIKTLIKVLQLANPEKQIPHLNAAAAKALAETRSVQALQPLLRALFEVSPIYQQVREALTRLGKPAVAELVKIFKGEHADINAFAKQAGLNVDCEVKSGPGSKCQAPGNLQFKSAEILGDLRAKEAIPLFVDALKKPGKVAFYDPKTGAPGPTTHMSVLNGLLRVHDDSAVSALAVFAKDPATPADLRARAIDVYSQISKSSELTGWFASLFQDLGQDENFRYAAGTAYARVVYTKDEVKPLQSMIDGLITKAKDKEKQAAGETDKAKKKELESNGQDYRSYAAIFEQYKTMANVGVKCTKDVKCYLGLIEKSADDLVKELAINVDTKLKGMTKETYRTAVLQRALIEIGKYGSGGGDATPGLLKHADISDGTARDALLLALVTTAKHPCDACAARLSAVIEDQKEQANLSRLTAETRVVLNFFVAQGAKLEEAVPAATPAATP